MSRKLFGWFAPKRGEEVLVMAERHLELTKNAVLELYGMVDAASQGDNELFTSHYMNVSRMEMEADDFRRRMVDALTTSEMFPEERDDLMELVRAVDWIADWSREAGRILNAIHLDRAPSEMREAALNMVKSDAECVSVLTDCLKMMAKDQKEAVNLANKVEMLEEDTDELYSIARKHLATLEFRGWTVGSIILLNEFLDSLETIADWCENTADIVRAVTVRMH